MSEDILEQAKVDYPKVPTTETTETVQQQEAAAKAKRSASKVFIPEEAIAKCKEIEDGDLIPALRRCIEKLTKELSDAREELLNGDTAKLKADNEALKTKLNAIREATKE